MFTLAFQKFFIESKLKQENWSNAEDKIAL